MPLVLVDQHAGKKAHIGTAAFENVGRRRTGQKLAGVLALVGLHDVAQDPVAANLLGHTTDNLLADLFAFSFGYPGGRKVLHDDRLHRHALVKPQARIVDCGVAPLGPAAGRSRGLVRSLVRGLAIRRLLEPELGEQVPLKHRIDPEPAFRPGAEDLAPEPRHLLPEGSHLLMQESVLPLQLDDPEGFCCHGD